jgi:hypothetical protein
MTIRGAVARKTVIDARGIDRVFHTPIQGIQPMPFTVGIFGLTITGAAAPPASAAAASGSPPAAPR